MTATRLFRRDFSLVILGQIVSLFGNAVLRYALPLYLLQQTHSPALFGVVSACSFLPMVALTPVGGLLADRVNKRNIMVILDFSTAALVLAVSILLDRVDLVALLLVALILLYGIQGAYQPAVQASIPALVAEEAQLLSANAAVNLVSSLAGLIGPVIGGAVFGFFGIRPILAICAVCFFLSAVMELFIRIPFVRREESASVLAVAAGDLRQGFRFLLRERPVLMKISLLLAGVNLLFSAFIVVGLPVIVTEHLGFAPRLAGQLYGYAQGALAAGGLAGGLLAGALGNRLRLQNAHRLLALCVANLLPMSAALWLPIPPMAAYLVVVACCFVMMVASSVVTIEIMAYVQSVTPADLIGKVMSLAMCVAMIAHPLGQSVYGLLFERLSGHIALLCLGAALASLLVALPARRLFRSLGQ